jgi:hypothetical protein
MSLLNLIQENLSLFNAEYMFDYMCETLPEELADGGFENYTVESIDDERIVLIVGNDWGPSYMVTFAITEAGGIEYQNHMKF